jgi:hypothetical protein
VRCASETCCGEAEGRDPLCDTTRPAPNSIMLPPYRSGSTGEGNGGYETKPNDERLGELLLSGPVSKAYRAVERHA